MTRERTAKIEIQLPEGVRFNMPLAGPMPRLLAFCIDLAAITVCSTILLQVMAIFEVVSGDIARAAAVLTYFCVSIFYGMGLEWFWRGQTIGKRILGLRVTDEQGRRLEPTQVIIRNLFRMVDALPALYLLGAASIVCSARFQRLGDIAANTIVTRIQHPEFPDIENILGEKYNSFRLQPHLAARLRQAVSPREAAVALQALLRRDVLEPQARLELFGELRRCFESKVEFPENIVDGLSDERYVCNAVDVLYNKI